MVAEVGGDVADPQPSSTAEAVFGIVVGELVEGGHLGVWECESVCVCVCVCVCMWACVGACTKTQ